MIRVAEAAVTRAASAASRIRGQYQAVVADRNTALLLGAGFLSEIGDWFNIVAIIALSFHYGEGALGVGGMLAARMLTRLLLQAPAGSLVDRVSGRRLLFVSQLAMAVIATAFILLVRFPALVLLYGLVIALEAVNCVARPAFMVALKRESPPTLRAMANGALFASQTTAQLIGPLLGAVALAPLGPAAVFALNGLTFLGVAGAVASLRGGLAGSPAEAIPVSTDESPAPEAATEPDRGYRWLLRRRDLSLYALVCLSLALVVQATIALFVVRANALGLGDGGVGLFYAAVAAGSIAGSVIAGARPLAITPLLPAAGAMTFCAAALALFGLAEGIVIAVAALIVAGFMTDFYEVVGLTYFQQVVPDATYGRFFSTFLIALSAGALAGALAGPFLERTVGAGAAIAVLAIPALLLALLFTLVSRRWTLR
ncbi:MAG: MFS transporter [Thermomicrobiales bacterium]